MEFCNGYHAIPGADTGFPEGGGGGQDIHKHPPLDIVRVTSLKNAKYPPLLDIHKHPPPWTLSA